MMLTSRFSSAILRQIGIPTVTGPATVLMGRMMSSNAPQPSSNTPTSYWNIIPPKVNDVDGNLWKWSCFRVSDHMIWVLLDL